MCQNAASEAFKPGQGVCQQENLTGSVNRPWAHGIARLLPADRGGGARLAGGDEGVGDAVRRWLPPAGGFPPGFQTGPRGMEWNGGGRGEGGGGGGE